jgi:hypothetical protein
MFAIKAPFGIIGGVIVGQLIVSSLYAQDSSPSSPQPTPYAKPARTQTVSTPAPESPVAVASPATADQSKRSDEPIEEIADVEEVPSGTVRDPQAFPAIERAINLLTAHTTRRNALQLTIDHRPFEKAFSSAWFRDWFGFDSGALKMGLGIRFGIVDDLDAGFLRLNGTSEVFDVYQFDARYRLLREDRHFINLALRAGPTWFAQPEKYSQALGGFGQLLIDRRVFDWLSVGTGLLYHSDSSGANKSNTDPNSSLAVAAWVDVRPLSWFVWNFELTASVAGYSEKYPIMSTGVKFVTNRHTFSLLVSNTQYISADGIVANTDRPLKDMILGFTITREIDL